MATIGWFAITSHFVLCILSFPLNTIGLLSAVFKFITFFTILTNLLVAITLTAHASLGNHLAFFRRTNVATAVATYAVIVELVYTGFLRWLWHPTGFQLVVDILLHDVMPVSYVIFWFRCIPKGTLRPRNVWRWLIYPLVFVPYNALCSTVSSVNPYPFLDASRIGYAGVSGCTLFLLLLFVAVGLTFIALDKWLAHLPQVQNPA